MKKTKRYADGGSAISVGAYMPQAPSLSGPFDRVHNTREVLDGMQDANNPVLRARKGGYVKSADGVAKRGKTKGKLV